MFLSRIISFPGTYPTTSHAISDTSRLLIKKAASCGESPSLKSIPPPMIVPLKVEKGDTVIFNRYAGTEVCVGNDMYLIIKECDILAKIK